MADINKLIEADEINCKESLKLFNQFDQSLSTSFDDAANLFNVFSRSFSQEATDDETLDSLWEYVKGGDLTEAEMLKVLNGEKPSTINDDLFEKITSHNNEYFSRRSRGLLLLQAYRAFMYAATDIRRLRVGTAFGFIRLEIEAVALMSLFQVDAKLAYIWFHLKGDKQGRGFYNKTKKDVLSFCDRYELTGEWNLASSSSQHSRFIGLVDGLTISSSSEAEKYTNNFSLAFQDFDPENPEQLLVRALYILRVQAKLLLPMQLALPEVSDPILLETRVPMFIKKIGALYSKFQKQFPDFMKSIGIETKDENA